MAVAPPDELVRAVDGEGEGLEPVAPVHPRFLADRLDPQAGAAELPAFVAQRHADLDQDEGKCVGSEHDGMYGAAVGGAGLPSDDGLAPILADGDEEIAGRRDRITGTGF